MAHTCLHQYYHKCSTPHHFHMFTTKLSPQNEITKMILASKACMPEPHARMLDQRARMILAKHLQARSSTLGCPHPNTKSRQLCQRRQPRQNQSPGSPQPHARMPTPTYQSRQMCQTPPAAPKPPVAAPTSSATPKISDNQTSASQMTPRGTHIQRSKSTTTKAATSRNDSP